MHTQRLHQLAYHMVHQFIVFYSNTAIVGYQETCTRHTPAYNACHYQVAKTCFSMYSQILFTTSRNTTARLLVYTCFKGRLGQAVGWRMVRNRVSLFDKVFRS